MIKINEIVIVEGRDDTRRLKEVFDVDTIETNGSALSKETLELIAKAEQKRGVIVLTDPDYSGEQIRKNIVEHIPTVKHAFIPREEAKPKKQGSLGVEHASDQTLKEALSKVMTPSINAVEMIDKSLLLDFGLLAGTDAKSRRKLLGEKLNIGYTNGKQLQKRLAMFQISEEKLKQVMQNVIEELNNG